MKKKPTAPKKDYQAGCIPFIEAAAKMALINQEGMKVQYFRIRTISECGGKITMTFDAIKWLKEQQATK